MLGNHHRFIRSLRENKDTALQQQIQEWQVLEQYIYQQYSLPVSKRASNFDSLLLRSNDHEVFADRFQLHQHGSTRELVFREQFQSAKLPETALVFGGIRYEADSLALATTNKIQTAATSYINLFPAEKKERAFHPGNWDYLPWTEKEAKDVAKRLRTAGVSVDIRTGFGASEAFFKQKSNRPSVPLMLHLATHGYFFPDADETATSGFRAAGNPLIRSGLILAGADQVWLGGEHLPEQEDGILAAFEISQLDLSGTELVVLSACETGLGDLHDSEGVYGLQRAFKSAGAKYLIMSLWSVRDHSAQEFMNEFYNAWLSEGKDIPEAFRSAQHALHSQYIKPFNPVMWAGFILLE